MRIAKRGKFWVSESSKIGIPLGKIASPSLHLNSQISAITLSTIELPFAHPGGSFESCLFYEDGQSEVLERYFTAVEARQGHERILAKLRGEIEKKVEDEPITKKRRIRFDEEA